MSAKNPRFGSFFLLFAGCLLMAFLLISSCEPPREVLLLSSERLIETPSEELFAPRDLASKELLGDWVAGEDRSWVWRPVGDRNSQLDGAEFVDPIPRERGAKRFSWTLRKEDAWAADEVQIVSLRIKGWRRGAIRLFWAAPGEEISRQRSIVAPPPKGRESKEDEVEIAVWRHPKWRGKIDRLQVHGPLLRKQSIRGETVALYSLSVRGERLAEALGTSWKVEIGGEYRNAVLTAPGMSWSWFVDRAVDGEMRFGFAQPVGSREPVRFTVEVAPIASGEGTLLFERTLQATGSGDFGRWHEASVPVVTRGPARIRLAADSPGEFDPLEGLSAWSNPELLERRSSEGGEPSVNVLLVSLDTLRADRLSLYGHQSETSPRLDAWASRRAAVFRNSVAASPWTLPSHVSIFSGLDALTHGINHSPPVPGDLELLPEILRQKGYATGAFTGGAWLRATNGFAQGYDRFRAWSGSSDGKTEIESGMKHLLEFLESNGDRPFFAFFHTYEIHDPYHRRMPFGESCPEVLDEDTGEPVIFGAVPAGRPKVEGFVQSYRFVKWPKSLSVKAGEPVEEGDLESIRCYYDSGVHFADQQLGKLFDFLQEHGLDRRTIVIITSDHGESLGENGLVKHAYLVDTNLVVPLIVAVPGATAGTRPRTLASAADILPTVLDLLGLPPVETDGISLRPYLAAKSADAGGGRGEAWSYAANSNRGIALRLGGRVRYTYNNTAWPPVQGRESLYSLENGRATDALKDRSTAGLRSRVREYAGSRQKGFALRVRSLDCDLVAGSISGSGVNPAVVKSWDLPPGAVSWAGKQRADFRAAKGEAYEVILEGLVGPLELEVRVAGCSSPDRTSTEPWTTRLHPHRLEIPRTLDLESGGWVDAAEPENYGPLTAIPLGGYGAAEEEPSEVDEEMLRQLRALGYVN